jgi:hypothetical protein
MRDVVETVLAGQMLAILISDARSGHTSVTMSSETQKYPVIFPPNVNIET